ncbi:MAG: hypothetical protein HQL73_06540 [Magnetococcales bacterium]|nr:hypothetical protein [Magnetococcales bacterium]
MTTNPTAEVTINIEPPAAADDGSVRLDSLSVGAGKESSGALLSRDFLNFINKQAPVPYPPNGIRKPLRGQVQSVITSVPGTALLEVDYSGPNPLSMQFLGGGHPECKELGWREEQKIEVIQFNGDNALQFDGDSDPSVIESTRFVNAQGQDRGRPIFRQMGGKKEFYAQEPVWGGMIISHIRRYRLYQVSYDVDDQRYGTWLEQIRDEIPSIQVFVLAGLSMAHASISRSVQWPQNNIVRTKPTKNLRKAEIERTVEIVRSFPSPKKDMSPSPDPRTGRTDYTDTERTIRIVYGVFETDADGAPVIVYDLLGNVVNALEIITENMTSAPVDNGYVLGRHTQKTTVE